MLSILLGDITFTNKKYFYLMLILLFLLPFHGYSLTWKKITDNFRGGFVEFTYDTTWVVPAGVKKITVTVIGGGGGSGHISSGGGGGGGSCIKLGSIFLVTANGGNGGNGGDSGSYLGEPGQTVSESVNVTGGQVLNIYVGGGGGCGTSPHFAQRGGGGNGGKGDNSAPGGIGGLNKGGGEGGGDGYSYSIADASGMNAISSTGAGNGGSATTPGNVYSSNIGGGASGGVGGSYKMYSAIAYDPTYATNRCSSCPTSLAPGSGGVWDSRINGGAGGVVQISW